MATHWLTSDWLSWRINWKLRNGKVLFESLFFNLNRFLYHCFDKSRKFLGHIIVHLVMFGPFAFSCIDVKSSTASKVPWFVLSLNRNTSRTCVWEDNGQPYPSSFLCKMRLCTDIFISTGQTWEVVQNRRVGIFPLFSFRQKYRKGHVTLTSAKMDVGKYRSSNCKCQR